MNRRLLQLTTITIKENMMITNPTIEMLTDIEAWLEAEDNGATTQYWLDVEAAESGRDREADYEALDYYEKVYNGWLDAYAATRDAIKDFDSELIDLSALM
jgi:hypothetical protein